MKKRRLLKLADLLEADAKNKKGIRFDLDDWGTADGEEPSQSCGTVACAMGLAVVSGAFRRAGLHNGSLYPDRWIVPKVGVYLGFSAASELFGINYSESEFLFGPDYYPETKRKGAIGERYVAKRIRDFVAGKVSPNL